MAIAGKIDVTIDLTRGAGFTDAVALTATGLPAGVTSAFSLNSLPDGTSSSTLTLTVANAASVGTTDITVTGTAGSLTHTAVVSLELHTSTIAGKVRFNRKDATVRLVGKSAVTSDTSGNFTFTDVKLPYDIYVTGTSGTVGITSIPTVNYYAGLTRLDPVVTQPTQFLNLFSTGPSTSTISGARGGTGNNTDPMFLTWSTGGTTTTTGTGSYSNFVVSWRPTSATKAGTLSVLQLTRGTGGAPVAYTGYGEAGDTLTAGGSKTVNFSLSVLSATAQLTGTITQPGGFPVPTLKLSQQIGGATHEIWNAPTTANASSLIPVLTGQKASFYATSTNASRQSQYVYPALTAATDVTFTLPTPAGMTGPLTGATNVTNTTPFEFTTTPNQVYLTSFENGNASYYVYGTSASITIPNVSELPLPSAADYTWTVTGFGPAVDANASADLAPLLYVGTAEYDGTPHSQTTNPTRTFTTQ